MNVNEMNADELRRFHMELQATISQVTDRLETLEPKPTMKRGDSWCVTLTRMVHIPETAVVVVKAETEGEAERVAEAMIYGCWDGDFDWDREWRNEDTDDVEVDGIDPCDDLPDYRLNDQGEVVAIDEDGNDLRLVDKSEKDGDAEIP